MDRVAAEMNDALFDEHGLVTSLVEIKGAYDEGGMAAVEESLGFERGGPQVPTGSTRAASETCHTSAPDSACHSRSEERDPSSSTDFIPVAFRDALTEENVSKSAREVMSYVKNLLPDELTALTPLHEKTDDSRDPPPTLSTEHEELTSRTGNDVSNSVRRAVSKENMTKVFGEVKSLLVGNSADEIDSVMPTNGDKQVQGSNSIDAKRVISGTSLETRHRPQRAGSNKHRGRNTGPVDVDEVSVSTTQTERIARKMKQRSRRHRRGPANVDEVSVGTSTSTECISNKTGRQRSGPVDVDEVSLSTTNTERDKKMSQRSIQRSVKRPSGHMFRKSSPRSSEPVDLDEVSLTTTDTERGKKVNQRSSQRSMQSSNGPPIQKSSQRNSGPIDVDEVSVTTTNTERARKENRRPTVRESEASSVCAKGEKAVSDRNDILAKNEEEVEQKFKAGYQYISNTLKGVKDAFAEDQFTNALEDAKSRLNCGFSFDYEVPTEPQSTETGTAGKQQAQKNGEMERDAQMSILQTKAAMLQNLVFEHQHCCGESNEVPTEADTIDALQARKNREIEYKAQKSSLQRKAATLQHLLFEHQPCCGVTDKVDT